jgi:hypothetical protein
LTRGLAADWRWPGHDGFADGNAVAERVNHVGVGRDVHLGATLADFGSPRENDCAIALAKTP